MADPGLQSRHAQRDGAHEFTQKKNRTPPFNVQIELPLKRSTGILKSVLGGKKEEELNAAVQSTNLVTFEKKHRHPEASTGCKKRRKIEHRLLTYKSNYL